MIECIPLQKVHAVVFTALFASGNMPMVNQQNLMEVERQMLKTEEEKNEGGLNEKGKNHQTTKLKTNKQIFVRGEWK